MTRVLRRRRSLALVGVVAVGALLLAGFALYWFGQSEPTPWNKPAKVDGALVHLRYTGSQCQDDASVDVTEEKARVILTVRTTVRAPSCPDVGVLYSIDAHLDAPLGDRELLDGACLMPEFAQYTACSGTRTE